MRLAALTVVCVLAAAASGAVPPDQYSVRDFGARGDGRTDDTAAFQRALDAAAAAKGGIVFAPRGNYRIAGTLRVGENVTLRGIHTVTPAWSQNKGTTLLTDHGHGDENAEAFISLAGHNACLQGLTVYYPRQDPDAEVPTPYPWTVRSLTGDNASIVDCLFVNPYKAVDFTGAGRHYIRGLHGRPLKIGIFVDHCLDVCRIENVHFWPFWAGWGVDKPISKWILDNGVAFRFARTDWQYVINTFCFGYKVGYHFVRTEHGVCNGNFLGIGADTCREAVRVDDCERISLLITNGEFVSSIGKGYGVYVAETNRGRINFSNCSFWHNTAAPADISGTGNVVFSSCNFIRWGETSEDYAIRLHGGGLIVQGCHFDDDRNDVLLDAGASSAVVVGNMAAGGMQVNNGIGARAQIGLNTTE